MISMQPHLAHELMQDFTCRDTTDASAESPKPTSPAQCNLSWYHTLSPAQNL